MALDVTVSGASSDSYATLAEANSLFGDRQWFSATWTAFTDATKEKWLREAVRSLDRLQSWRGIIADEDQRLAFPRDIGEDTYYPDDEIHRNIKEAQLELVIILQAKQDSTTGDIEVRSESKVGALSGTVSVDYLRRNDASGLEKVQGGNIASVYALMSPWRGSKFLDR